MGVSLERSALALLCLVVLAGTAGVAVGGTATQPAPPTPGDATNATANASVLDRVPLVTGGTVTVLERGDETVYRTEGTGATQTIETPDGTYVFPVGVDFERFDPALFNVDRLRAQRPTDGGVPVIVTLDGTPAGGSGTETVRSLGVDTERRLPEHDAVAGTVYPGTAARGGGGLSVSPRVESVVYDAPVTPALANATRQVDAGRARARFDASGENVTVAVIDTGINESHPDLDEGTLVYEQRFLEDDTKDGSHGTHVAGILAGDGDASNGTYTGVAPDASLLDLDVFGEGRTRVSTILAAIAVANERRPDVVSMSLGAYSQESRADDLLSQAVERTVDNGTAVVISAGNDGPDAGTIGTPGIAAGAITVGATNENGTAVVDFSSRGPTTVGRYLKPDLVAPGENVYSANTAFATEQDYVALSGTSMSAPMVSGAAAVVLSERPGLDPAALKRRLVSTADPLERASNGTGTERATVYDQGGGMLNVTAALATNVTVGPATLDFGSMPSTATETRSLTVFNGDDRPHNVSLSARTTTENGTVVSDAVALNRTDVTVPAEGSAAVAVTVDAGEAGIGANGVRIVAVDRTTDRRYSTSAGFVVGYETAIEKVPLSPGGADDDAGIAFLHDGETTRSVPIQFENGTETVFSEAANVSVVSGGRAEGTPVLTAANGTVGDGPVTLDERRTERVSLDTSDRRSSRPLRPLAVTATAELSVPGYWSTDTSVAALDPNSTHIRLAPSFDTADIIYRLVGATSNESDVSADTPALYALSYELDNVTAREIPLRQDGLRRFLLTHHRRGQNATYNVSVGSTPVGVLGDRRFQSLWTNEWWQAYSVHRYGEDGALLSTSKYRLRELASVSEVQVGRQPIYTGLSRIDIWSDDADTTTSVDLYPSITGSGVAGDTFGRSRSAGARVKLEISVDGYIRERFRETLDSSPPYFLGRQFVADIGGVEVGDRFRTTTTVIRPNRTLSTRSRLETSSIVGEQWDDPAVRPLRMHLGLARGITADNAITDRDVLIPVDVGRYRNASVSVSAAVAENGTGVQFESPTWSSVPVYSTPPGGTDSDEAFRYWVSIDHEGLTPGEPLDLAVRVSDGTNTTTQTVVDAFAVRASTRSGPGDVTGNGRNATDPDNDGFYEDVTGSGFVSVADAQALLGVSDHSAFDVTGDGVVDSLDAWWLFDEYVAGIPVAGD